MVSRIVTSGALAAITGAAMLAASSAPSPAFTLSSPSFEQPVVGADVESVWWHGGWHGGWHRGWGGWHHGWGCIVDGDGIAAGDGMVAGVAGAERRRP
jgi:hypothetical protein